MKLRVNWQRFFLIFALTQIVLFASGCTAAWITAAQGLVPLISSGVSAILSFVLALQGKTLTAEQAGGIQKIAGDVNTQLTNLGTLLNDAAQNATAGIVSQIQAVLSGITANLQSILTGFNVTDPATTSKLTEFVQLAIAAVGAVLTVVSGVGILLPHASSMSQQALENSDKAAAASLAHAKQSLQEAYQVTRNTPTASAEVNEALLATPENLQ